MSRQRKKRSEAQIKELQTAQLKSKAAVSALRYQAVRLYGLGYTLAMIQEICKCSRPSLWAWNRKYHSQGIVGLVDQRQGGNHAVLRPLELETLHDLWHAYKPDQRLEPTEYEGNGEFWSLTAVACLVEKRFGVRYKSRTSYRNLMAKCEFSYQRMTQHYQSHALDKGVALKKTPQRT